MKFVSTKIHAVLDYAMVLLLLSSPRLFRLMDLSHAAVWLLPCVVGLFLFNTSIITRYEGGAFAKIPMRVHLGIDKVLGLFLALSPWLFGFSQLVYQPHLFMGIALLLIAFVTRSEPQPKRQEKRKPLIYGDEENSPRYQRKERVSGL